MTKFYLISPKWKKSIYEYSKYENDDNTKSFTTEEMYRWGHCVVKVEDGNELADIIGNPIDSRNEFEFDHTMVEEQEVDDQCSFYFQNCKGIEEEELDEKFEEEGYDYLEQYTPTYSFVEVHGKLKVTDITEQYNNETFSIS